MCSIYELLSITNLYCNYCKFVHRYVGISRKEENHFSTRRRSLVMIDASIVSLKQPRSTAVPALACGMPTKCSRARTRPRVRPHSLPGSRVPLTREPWWLIHANFHATLIEWFYFQEEIKRFIRPGRSMRVLINLKRQKISKIGWNKNCIYKPVVLRKGVGEFNFRKKIFHLSISFVVDVFWFLPWSKKQVTAKFFGWSKKHSSKVAWTSSCIDHRGSLVSCRTHLARNAPAPPKMAVEHVWFKRSPH